MYGDEAGLVPRGLGVSAVAPFIELMLATLGLLGTEETVRQYSQADPDAHRAMRALSTQVAEAGIRVRDTAKHGDKFDEHLRMFTAEEYWKFNLAVDVIAMFATGGGLRPNTHRLIMRDLGRLDGFVHSHHWKKEVQKAGDGPAEFRDLRAHIPYHKPHPR
jgi:hypothetical protein